MSQPDAPPPAPEPGDLRPPRRLDRPPSDRFGDPRDGPRGANDASGAPIAAHRGLPVAMLIGLAGAIVIALLNAVLTITVGLMAVAAVTGYLVGAALPAGTTPGMARRGFPLAAVSIAVAAIVLGALGTWLIAVVAQGGVIGPLDYLAQTMGVLLLGQVLVAGVAAWLAGR